MLKFNTLHMTISNNIFRQKNRFGTFWRAEIGLKHDFYIRKLHGKSVFYYKTFSRNFLAQSPCVFRSFGTKIRMTVYFFKNFCVAQMS